MAKKYLSKSFVSKTDVDNTNIEDYAKKFYGTGGKDRIWTTEQLLNKPKSNGVKYTVRKTKSGREMQIDKNALNSNDAARRYYIDSSAQESTMVSPNIQFEKRDTNKWQKEATQKQYDDFKEKSAREEREKQKILEEAKIKNISNTFAGDMAYRLGADEYIQEKVDQASSTAQLVPTVGTVLGALDLGNDLQRIKNKNPNTTNLDVAEDVLSMLPTWKWAQKFRNLPKGPQAIPLTKLQKAIKGIYDTGVEGFKLADFLEDSHYTEKSHDDVKRGFKDFSKQIDKRKRITFNTTSKRK